jgi:hypothetical protein
VLKVKDEETYDVFIEKKGVQFLVQALEKYEIKAR